MRVCCNSKELVPGTAQARADIYRKLYFSPSAGGLEEKKKRTRTAGGDVSAYDSIPLSYAIIMLYLMR